MEYQIEIKGNYAIENEYSSHRGKDAAHKLIEILIEDEPAENHDECIFALIQELSALLDRKITLPCSMFFKFELQDKINHDLKKGRYRIKNNIREEENELPKPVLHNRSFAKIFFTRQGI